MSTLTFTQSSVIHATPAEVFDWHTRPGAFERLTPPFEPTELVERQGDFEHAVVTLRTRFGPFWFSGVSHHHDVIPGRQFRDTAVRGPFRRWTHLHRMDPDGSGGTTLTDTIQLELPLAPLTHALLGRHVLRRLERVFAWRHRITAESLASRKGHPMRILVTGASGLMGAALVPLLTTAGHSVRRLVRGPAEGPEGYHWDPARGEIDVTAFEGVDAVVHLAGESLAVRWQPGTKDRILRSRVDGTRLIAETVAGLTTPPQVLVSASAVGYYGNRGDELLDETSAGGKGFLADVCRLWEGAAEPARAAGIRVVHPRFGMVLSPRGGALATMLTPFRLGVGGPIGNGRQYWPWISLEDVIAGLLYAVTTPELTGPVNFAAPQAVTSAEFAHGLAGVLHRPGFMPLPAFAARLVMGEMADELLLSGQRLAPSALASHGYTFRDPELVPALQRLLAKPAAR